MNTKTLILFFFALLALLGGWKYFSSRGTFNNTSDFIEKIRSIKNDSIDTIVIKDKIAELTLQKFDKVWKINNDTVANVYSMEEVWRAMETTDVSGPISRNSENHKKFELDIDSATMVEFRNGENVVFQLVLGKIENSGKKIYIRDVDSADVYVADLNFRTLFSLEEAYWRNETKDEEEENL